MSPSTSQQPLDFVYDRRQSPFLPLTRGLFGFLHTTGHDTTGMSFRELTVQSLGTLALPSGTLLAADPFRGLRERFNPRYSVPAGTYSLLLTRASIGTQGDSGVLRTAYASVVFDPEALHDRQLAQARRIRNGQDPQLDRQEIELLSPFLPDGSFSEAEAQRIQRPGVSILTGCMALCDAEGFEATMPPDLDIPGRGWLENIFDHGVEGSWFDELDSMSPWPKGMSNHLLPDSHDKNIAIFPTGWGDGRYFLRMEHWDEKPMALHIDFNVIPFDPLSEAAGQ